MPCAKTYRVEYQLRGITMLPYISKTLQDSVAEKKLFDKCSKLKAIYMYMSTAERSKDL